MILEENRTHLGRQLLLPNLLEVVGGSVAKRMVDRSGFFELGVVLNFDEVIRRKLAEVKKGGATIFSTKPSIDANEDTSLTGTAAVLSTTTATKGDKITFNIDAAGTGAKGLMVWMEIAY